MVFVSVVKRRCLAKWVQSSIFFFIDKNTIFLHFLNHQKIELFGGQNLNIARSTNCFIVIRYLWFLGLYPIILALDRSWEPKMQRVLLVSASCLSKKVCYTITILCTSRFLRYAKYIFLQKLEAQLRLWVNSKLKTYCAPKKQKRPFK